MNAKTTRKPMSVDDLQALYSELRGSSAGPALMDARACFLERQMQEAHAKLSESYETYKESRRRILRQDPEKQFDAKTPDRDRQVRRLLRRQEKARDLLDRFEDFLSQLERLADKESSREEIKSKPVETDSSEGIQDEELKDVEVDSAEAPTALRADAIGEDEIKLFAQLIGDRQIEFVSSRYAFRPLETTDDVLVDAVYLLRKGDRCYLLKATTDADDAEKLQCVDLANPKTQVALTASQMVRLSQKRKLVLLLPQAMA
ncbi:hypothetical protein [Roseiconus lacunae]|uniref:hypothetical protein n=2 Tax=Roseiconus lacunae TaxID=2605694 RepID=UPI0011F2F395|nr:hypothetical protein [Roseiconus lacunae]